MDSSNTKLGEGVNHLFYSLLPVCCVGKHTVKTYNFIVSTKAWCFYLYEFSSALIKHLLLCSSDLCMCVSLHS